jgi:hypothetical protein
MILLSHRLLEDAVHAIIDSFNCYDNYSLFEIELTVFRISGRNVVLPRASISAARI